MNEERLYELLLKELKSELTDAERVELKKYRNTQAQDVKAIEDILQHTTDLSYPSTSEISEGWNSLERQISQLSEKQPERSISTFKRRRWMAIAASLLILCLAYFTLRPSTDSFYADSNMITEELNDGSKLVLNAHSTTDVEPDYNNETRTLNITGEAYIEAIESPAPMIVHSEQLLIRVVGTRFNVMDYIDDPIASVTLYEGQIDLTLPNGKNIHMQAGDHLCWNKVKKTMSPSTISTNEPGWVNGRIVFDNTLFSEVFTRLERMFQIQIEDQDVLTGLHYTDSGDDTQQLASILSQIEKATGTTFQKVDPQRYRLSRKN